MYLKGIELSGFKSFAKKSEFEFSSSISAIVGPNGSGKSNVAEAFRFVLGEQSMKSMRGKRGEDLIWGGSQATPRSNRALVKVTFDNTKRLLDLDFDEVEIERVVHRDGINEYKLNGSSVRLKDVVELLAGANIGSTGHHIISQGEADRILNANLRERREMIEDALGLKIFQYKKNESERKLDRTAENIKQVQSLRREIAPHLKFLKKQVDKLEKSRELRVELKEKLHEYLKREEVYLAFTEEDIASRKEGPKSKLETLEVELEKARKTLESASKEDIRGQEVLTIERELSGARSKRDELSREVGRIEGQVSFAERHGSTPTEASSVPMSELKAFESELDESFNEANKSDDPKAIRLAISKIKSAFTSLIEKYSKESVGTEAKEEVRALKEKKEALDTELSLIESHIDELSETYKNLQNEIETSKDEERGAEREVFRITTEKRELETGLRDMAREEEMLTRAREEFKQNLEEGAVLGGREVLDYSNFDIDHDSVVKESREIQDERRKTIEKIKIRLEEFGGGSGEEIMKEYREVVERDEFLEREIEDLERSAETLKQLISDLEERLGLQFREGIEKINKEFQHFFELLFGGGTAELSVIKQQKRKKRDTDIEISEEEIDESDETEEGIDIEVALPRKKIKGLEVLSGGERALTSISLLFAMSQVNPPPFLILDETDAALDEANSRKYSTMISELSEKTQLILITHNRETMSVAGILYGVTMGADGVSKLLSVKFEDAVRVTK
ncbi:MAG: AAA family ATPase [Candidatus Pacebacteria bacterium]|jgi:chromosome segregation protein|nr:AAA family ATPase [Candidatus Paceibacterota bacterium]